ncbi:MAG: oligosaccharide flippase family protein [Rhodoferax sp.]|nr:oligosaccharide flippase family protein [Rhodoferax sp.]MDP3650232.1 oligosaccharide flippase family protein [Rhodoferax sp.]
MTEQNKFGSGVLWAYLQSWIARGITTVSFLVVGWHLGPTEFGLFSVVAATLMLAELLCEQTLSQTVVQLGKINTDNLSAVFFIGLGGGLVFACALGLGANQIAEFFSAPELANLLQAAALCPVLIGLSAVPIGLLRRDLAFKVLAQRTVLSSGISSALGIALVITGFGAWGLVLQAILYYAIGLAVLWRHCPWRPARGAHLYAMKDVGKLAIWNTANKFADFAETRGIELLVGSMGGMQALGVFAFANKLAQTAFQTISSPALEVVFAEVARHKETEGIRQAVRNGQLIIATVPSGFMLGLACIATPLLTLLYGDRWVAAAEPLSILSIAFMARGLLYVLGSALLALSASRTTTLIASLRAGLTVTFCYLALRQGAQASGAAWSFLVSALLVAPISSVVLSQKIGVSVKALVAVPLKVCIASLAGIAVMRAGRLVGDGAIATIAFAVLAGMFFLWMVLVLNAGLIAHSLKSANQMGPVGKLLHVIYKAARQLLVLREWLRLIWFEMTLRMSAYVHRSKSHTACNVLLVPADTSELDGSLGDQALLLGFGTLRNANTLKFVVSETFRTSEVFSSIRFIRAWSGVWAGWILGKQIRTTKELYVIGADVMDGYYSSAVSRQRLILARVFSQANRSCGVLSFSFNAAPHPEVVKEFQSLPKIVRICLRDAVSLERFERLVGRPAQLVSDLAFLVHPTEASEVATIVKPWVSAQRQSGRRILGINVNPQVVAHLASDTEPAIARSVAQACETLINNNTSVVLIPHDFRPGCADLRVMGLVWKNLSAAALRNALLLEKPFTAQEIKSVCKDFDLVFSARMHLAIGALSVGTPVCGMQYQGKFAGLFQHFAMGNDIFVAPEDALDPERLATFLTHHLDQCKSLQRQIEGRIHAVRELARLNAPQASV